MASTQRGSPTTPKRRGDHRSLARSARLAFLSAAARTSHREAVRHGERALSVQQYLSPDELAELQMRLATSMIALARGGDAEALAHRAVQHWHAAGDDRREAESLLVLSSSVLSLGRTEEAMVPLGRSVEILERYEPGRELTLAYVRLTSAHMLARERDPAVEWGERAIALATRHDDAVLLGMALAETGIADVMDGRFEGLVRVRQAIALGRQHELPAVVSGGYSQIGSGCGEMRRYDDAVPALIEGSAWAAHHSLEANRRYQVAWLARCRFDLGQWDEAEELARDAIAGSRDVAIARFVGLNTLGWLRARRGDADVFALLDEALDMARSLSHLQRLWPNAVARAEAGWLADDLEPHVPLLEEVHCVGDALPPWNRDRRSRGVVASGRSDLGGHPPAPRSRSRRGSRATTCERRRGSVRWAAPTKQRACSPKPAMRARCVRRWRRSIVSGRHRWYDGSASTCGRWASGCHRRPHRRHRSVDAWPVGVDRS